MKHKIVVIGTGYVGLTTAACLANLGNEVVGVDVDDERIEALRLGHVPFYEPGLAELVASNQAAGRLRFTTSYGEAVPSASFVFIAVGTPMDDTGDADLTNVRSAANSIAPWLSDGAVIINKSTVPIGTGDVVSSIVAAIRHDPPVSIAVVSNPEFLREGSAIHNFLHPDRIVLGGHDEHATGRVAALYGSLEAPTLVTTLYAAEMIKYASNAFLATKISFINEIARICEKVDADVSVVADGMGMDPRIGRAFLDAGTGYGGSCFPKDVMALARTSERIGAHPQLLHAVMQINRGQPLTLAEKVHDLLGTLRGQRVGILGLSFKPETDDMREAPSIAVIEALTNRGAIVRAYDPAAMDAARRHLPHVEMATDPYDAAADADALVVVTEWAEFRDLDLHKVKARMHRPVIVDGRNLFDPALLRSIGFVYRGIGR